MKKSSIVLLIVSLIVIVFSVTYAFFKIQIIGDAKNITVNSKDLKIVFNGGDSITGSELEQFNYSKTFTIENKSDNTYKYNIIIKDLVNTFKTDGFLLYKITSDNNGYSMNDFDDVPKSETEFDTVLAYNVSIDAGVKQTYTIEFKYTNSTDIDQSADMEAILSGKVFIDEGTEEPKTLYEQLLSDKTTRPGARTDFSTILTTDNTKTLYTGTEDNTTVYYFAGNATDNWVKFGGFYWRIIRTNSDGGVRLLYHGTSTAATDAYIGTSAFNTISNDPMYVGYKYGTIGSLENNRTNENSSTIKTYLDNWYKNNLTVYTKYLSGDAVYCNDRNLASGQTYSTTSKFNYATYERIITNKQPTYNCTTISDAFSVNNTSAKLDYPIGLMTIDEAVFAGGVGLTKSPTWYYYNSANGSSTGLTNWWLLTSYVWFENNTYAFSVSGSSTPGFLDNDTVKKTLSVRPVISLKSCIKYSTGNGTAENPYTILETGSGC